MKSTVRKRITSCEELEASFKLFGEHVYVVMSHNELFAPHFLRVYIPIEFVRRVYEGAGKFSFDPVAIRRIVKRSFPAYSIITKPSVEASILTTCTNDLFANPDEAIYLCM